MEFIKNSGHDVMQDKIHDEYKSKLKKLKIG